MATEVCRTMGAVALAAGISVGSLWMGSAAAEVPAPIRIGEINSYTGPAAAFTASYRKGFDMAVDEVNKAGGVLGRPLEILYRDDNYSPADGVRLANELILQDKVDLLAGTFFSPVALAVANVADQQKKLFVAAEALSDLLTWQKGSRYVFRIRNPTYMLVGMVADQAASLSCTKWATVAGNDQASVDTIENFKKFLAGRKPEVKFVGAVWIPPGQVNPGTVVDSLEALDAQCIFNSTYGSTLLAIAREGNTRGFFEGKSVVSTLAGEPEYLDPMGEDTPVGWYVTGYPWSQDDRPAHKKFREDFQARYHDFPRMGALIAYVTVKSIAAGITRAGSIDTEKMIQGFKGVQFDTPVGPVTLRAGDHQATFGSWVGRLALEKGHGVMVDWKWLDGKDYLPPEDIAAAWRPAGAND